jgi:hypothetical protein
VVRAFGGMMVKICRLCMRKKLTKKMVSWRAQCALWEAQ